jgi:excisionase family DNA binding protein
MLSAQKVIRPAEHLIHGINGPFVVIDGAVCAMLDRLLRLDQIGRKYRGQNEQFDQSLAAIRLAGAAYSERSGSGADSAPQPDVPPHSVRQQNPTVSTTKAASILGMTDRSVRRAIREKRLPATCLDGRYRINRDDLTNYLGAQT